VAQAGDHPVVQRLMRHFPRHIVHQVPAWALCSPSFKRDLLNFD